MNCFRLIPVRSQRSRFYRALILEKAICMLNSCIGKIFISFSNNIFSPTMFADNNTNECFFCHRKIFVRVENVWIEVSIYESMDCFDRGIPKITKKVITPTWIHQFAVDIFTSYSGRWDSIVVIYLNIAYEYAEFWSVFCLWVRDGSIMVRHSAQPWSSDSARNWKWWSLSNNWKYISG